MSPGLPNSPYTPSSAIADECDIITNIVDILKDLRYRPYCFSFIRDIDIDILTYQFV